MSEPEHEGGTPEWVSRLGLLLGPALFVATLLAPLPTLSLDGRAIEATRAVHVVLGLTLWMATWWMTEALPLAATSLLPLVVLTVGGVMPAKAVAPTYFDDTIGLFLGGFLLALAMEKSDLHRRIAYAVVRVAGSRPRAIVLGFFAASAMVSMWVSNTATALMLMPVAATVLRARVANPTGSRGKGERNFAACVVLAVAYGASLGGVGTLVGTPPNKVFKGAYEKVAAAQGIANEITFGSWLVIGVPLVLVLVPAAWWLLTRVVLPVPRELPGAEGTSFHDRLRPAGPMRFAEGAVLTVFLATALAWITHAPMEIAGSRMPLTGWDRAFAWPFTGKGGQVAPAASFVSDGTIAVLAALLLFALPSRVARGDRLLTWSFAHRHMPWGALLLFGGSFALAESFQVAGGLNDYLAAAFRGLGGLPHGVVLLIVAFGMTALSEVANNTAATSMMMPVLAGLARGIGEEPLPLMLMGTLAASCGFALPIATMPNTIAYGTGDVTVGQMGRAGLALDVLATLVMVAAVLWLLPLAR